MRVVLRALNAFTHKRYRLVFGLWLALVVVALPFASRESSHLIAGGVPAAGSQSATVEATLRQEFPTLTAENTYVLLSPTRGATGADLSAAIRRIARAVRRVPHVTLSMHDREVALFAAELVSPLLLPLHVAGSRSAVEKIDQQLLGTLNSGTSRDDVGVYLIGEGALWAGLQDTVKRDLTKAEVFGFPLLLLVLWLIFGSIGAALLPVTLGIGTVLVTGAVIYLLSTVMQLSTFVTDTASLIGIGVAVDYSLIILSRVRQELAAGNDLAQAQMVALLTSGRTVIFSGATVALSLCALWLIPDVTLRSMTIGATLAVCIAVVMAVTMLPALIWMLGASRVSASVHQRWRHAPSGRSRVRRLSWQRWTRIVTARPLLTSLGAGGCLLLLAAPALSMHMSTGALRLLSNGNATRIGFEKTARITGPGALGPIYVVAAGGSSRDEEHELGVLRGVIRGMPHVKEIGPTTVSQSHRYATYAVLPTIDPESPGAKRLVRNLRGAVAARTRTTHVSVEVGGATAIQVDQEAELTRNIWKVIVAILVLSGLVLTVLLRSIVLPIKAVLMNLLAVGAAYGVLVAVFQWGWTDPVFGFHSLGYLETLTPPLVLAIVFGLSMDYEIFLLSRIREQWEKSGDAKDAVTTGLANSAMTISNAALLLVCVFAVFVGTGVTAVKEIGLGGAVAIAVDVTLIRLVLVPALMTLLGHWNWWWPSVFERLLPARAGDRQAIAGADADALGVVYEPDAVSDLGPTRS